MPQALRRPRGLTGSYLTRNWVLTAHRSIEQGYRWPFSEDDSWSRYRL